MSAPLSQPSATQVPAASTPPGPDRTSRRWIRRRLAQLDAEEDYAEIVALSSIYRLDDFVGDWSFTQSMARFSTGYSGIAIAREGKGKLLTDTDRRFEDTMHHFLVWAEYGPESPQSKRSLNMINALHAKYQKAYPAAFDDLDLWVYVIAFQICGMTSILSECLGLPEPSEKEKIARVRFGKKLAEGFVYIDGRPLTAVLPALDSYEEWVGFLHEYEARRWTYDANSAAAAAHVLEGWERRSKIPFRWLSRALVTSFWYDGMFDCNGVERPGRFERWAAKNYLRLMLTLGVLLPDPKASLPERMRRAADESGTPLPPVLRATRVKEQAAAGARAGGCPMGYGAEPAARPEPGK